MREAWGEEQSGLKVAPLGTDAIDAMNIHLFRYAFILILLSLIGGLFVPLMAIPRLGLSAHTIGILSGVLLIAIGAIWQHFRLSRTQALMHEWAWLYSSYANWLACLLGALLGAGKMTPIASAAAAGPALAETLVVVMFGSVGLSSFIAVGLSLWGLRGSTSRNRGSA